MTKKVLIAWLAICAYIYAEPLVDVYRKDGLSALEVQIEETLQNPLYWKEYLADKDVTNGYYEFDTPIVVVDKKSKIMELYHMADGKMKLDSTQEVITGKMGDKQKEGDLKTPVGVYDIKSRFVPKDTFYGPIAYELSYPNLLDKLGHKNGYGIWIHGFPLDDKKRDGSTKGCVVMTNDIIEEFDRDLGVANAVVIISENGKRQVTKEEMTTLLTDLYRWRYAWKISDVEKYLEFYSKKNFKRYDKRRFGAFAAMKRQIFSRKQKKIIRFTNLAISPYPSTKMENLFRIVFDEYYDTKRYKFTGKKELYVQLLEGHMKIIAEK